MKTKTLLIAAAALAAGVISSQAQVYSQNVVGYANVPLAVGYNLVANQFNCGVSNGANEVFANVPDGTQFLQWNGSGYTYSYKDASAPPAIWYMDDYSTPTNPPTVRAGEGVFIFSGVATNYTMVGTVAALVGGTATNALVTGYNMVGSKIPYAGALTNTVIGFNNLPDGTQLLTYNGSGYTFNYYDQSAPPAKWYMSDYSTVTNSPTITVGQGYFLFMGGATPWVQGLNP